ncbi:hypothetical protein [Methanobrevibacter sp. DSM 116169]|uniref:hypothetical protein n=1 Tax=Methanobrevibacter sp. DSM 116169 TaxID=3242727 RepID=UPI0038FD01EC
MYLEKICSPISNLSDVQYKFCFPGLEKREKQSKFSVDRSVYTNDSRYYAYNNSFCKHCFSRDLIKHGFNSKMLISVDGDENHIFVQKYLCKKCGKISQTEFQDEYDPYCNFSNNTLNKSKETMSLERVSLRNLSKNHKTFNNIKISHETVRKSLILNSNLYYINTDVELSNYYGYDEQWVKINKKWQYRCVIFDLINNVPIAEELTDNLSKKFIKNFIDKNIPPHKRKFIVTDLKKEYDNIMRQLGFDHQYCTFHLNLNINKNLTTFYNKAKNKYIKELKNNDPEMSKTEIDELVDEKLKTIKKEINEYKQWFWQLFQFKTYGEALEFIEEIKEKLPEFPEILGDYLKNNFMPIYKKFLVFLKKEHKTKACQTNNKTENYIGNIMPKSYKKKFRTEIGLMTQIKHRIKNWIKNRKTQLTN